MYTISKCNRISKLIAHVFTNILSNQTILLVSI